MSHDASQFDASQPDASRPKTVQPETVQKCHGETLTVTGVLETAVGCSTDAMPTHLQAWLRELSRNVTTRRVDLGLFDGAAATSSDAGITGTCG